DRILQGTKDGYKFEIIVDDPEPLAQEMMTELRHGVTELTVHGMYTHKEKSMIVCIIRKRELSKMMKILKKYPQSFASFTRVNEVFGNFKR
ncbi:MAG: YitT family protein, partial [Clostridia bacterium]|nr:YitT family protein [Clostridia bacterium]